MENTKKIFRCLKLFTKICITKPEKRWSILAVSILFVNILLKTFFISLTREPTDILWVNSAVRQTKTGGQNLN